ncbi:hypothetical protein RhiirA4_397737, partial [Rhizophagus irregularis]
MVIPDHSNLGSVKDNIKKFEANPDENPGQIQPLSRSRSPVGRLPLNSGIEANAEQAQLKAPSSNSSGTITYSYGNTTEETVEQKDIADSSNTVTSENSEKEIEVKPDEPDNNVAEKEQDNVTI